MVYYWKKKEKKAKIRLMSKNKIILSKDQVKYIAHLSNLFLSEEEAGKITRDLSDTLAFIEKIKKVDTTNLQPTCQVTGLINVFREDKIIPSLTQEEALKNAKSVYNGYFKIQAIME